MAVRTPHFPDLLFGSAARLRRWEGALMGLLADHGYRELHPSLVLREAVPEGALRFFDGDELVALRWDFTVALAGLLAAALPDPAGPRGLCRRSVPAARAALGGGGALRGGLRAHPTRRRVRRREADVELARMLMAIPGLIGLKSAILHLGNAALVRRPLEAEGLFGDLADAVVAALSRRAPHRVREALDGHPSAARLLAHAEALLSELDGAGTLSALEASPYAGLLEEERNHMDRALRTLLPILPPNLELRVDLADVAGLGFYTGPTLRLWAPGAQQELAAGGRYDRLFPDLGRPWHAAGFCVRLSRLLDLAATRPDLFERDPDEATTLLIAFPKGRLGDELVPKLAGTPLALDTAALKSRVLRIPTATPGVAALLLKGADLPRYVAAGVASLGIVGSDTLDEMDMDLLELADLGFGACRLSLCAKTGITLDDLRAKPHLRLATKFPKATEAWLSPRRPHRRAGAPQQQRGAGAPAGPGGCHRGPGADRRHPQGPRPGGDRRAGPLLRPPGRRPRRLPQRTRADPTAGGHAARSAKSKGVDRINRIESRINKTRLLASLSLIKEFKSLHEGHEEEGKGHEYKPSPLAGAFVPFVEIFLAEARR